MSGFAVSSGGKNIVQKPGLEIYLGMEINPLPTDKADASMDFCILNEKDSINVFEGLKYKIGYALLEDGDNPGVYVTQTMGIKNPLVSYLPQEFQYLIRLQYLISLRANKYGLLKSYNKENGRTEHQMKTSRYSEEMLAEIHICLGGTNPCLTGCGKTRNELLSEMRASTKPGVNRILVILDEGGKKIMSCLIDNILYIDNEQHKVKTSR